MSEADIVFACAADLLLRFGDYVDVRFEVTSEGVRADAVVYDCSRRWGHPENICDHPVAVIEFKKSCTTKQRTELERKYSRAFRVPCRVVTCLPQMASVYRIIQEWFYTGSGPYIGSIPSSKNANTTWKLIMQANGLS